MDKDELIFEQSSIMVGQDLHLECPICGRVTITIDKPHIYLKDFNNNSSNL